MKGNDDPSRASSAQREQPQRGLEALSNFYGRLSTDHGSLRTRNAEASLSSYAGSMRRSSSGTSFYNAHSVNGSDEVTPAAHAAPPQPKSPRVYTSFSAAAAAASRSSLNKRASQASIPSNAAASPSIRNSPAMSSPRTTTSSTFADATTSRGGGGGGVASGLVSAPSQTSKGASFDIAAINRYSPGSLASAFPWLSNNPDAASHRSRDPPLAGSKPTSSLAASTQTKTNSPPIAQYSKGKGYGWSPNKEQAPPKSSSKARFGSTGSQIDSMGRGLGLNSASELDLPERMRGQRKGAPAPPRLSQDHMALSIDEELRPRTSFSKETAFSRLGRAFRRKSKTGSEMKADIGADLRSAPPVPAVPSKVAGKAPANKLTDPFAEKALKASSGLQDRSHQAAKPSMDIDASGQEPPAINVSERIVAAADESQLGESASAMPPPKALDQEEASTDTGPGQLTTDSAQKTTDTDPASPSSRPIPDPAKRPMSMDSITSSAAHRKSFAFLASAISMGAIASEAEEASEEPAIKEAELGESKEDADAAATPTDSTATTPPRLSSRSTSITAPPADLDSSLERQAVATEPTATSSAATMSRISSADRRRLEPKSATRNDNVPGILSDFLRMDAETSAKESLKDEAKKQSRAARDDRSAADTSTDNPSAGLERSYSGTSGGRRSSLSSSPKAVRPPKGVYMSPPAGPNMGGFTSPFYVAPLTSADAGVVNRPGRPTGRRASASSRSVHSDDSKSMHSGSRRGSAALAVTEGGRRDEQQPAAATRTTEGKASQSRDVSEAEKAKRTKSFGNLRASTKDASQETMPRASTSQLPSSSVLFNAGEGRSPATLSSKFADPGTATKHALEVSQDGSPSRTRSITSRFLRRPKTSGAEAGLSGMRSDDSSARAEGYSGSRRGSALSRISIDGLGLSSKQYSSSPTEATFDMLATQSLTATPTKSRDTNERQASKQSTDQARTSGLDRKESSTFGRGPSEQSIGATTPSSSRIESQGGAAGLFGNPTTKPRTSSLLPSFGFSRSRTGSSAGADSSGKSPGSFGSSARSASSIVRRDTSEQAASSSSTLQPAEANGTTKSPRVSSGSRRSFTRQLSAGTTLSDAEAKQSSEKPEKKVSLSAFLPYDDEDAPEYAERIATTAPKAQIAAILASSADAFYAEALHHFMTRFWFNSLPLDIALRKLLMDLHLPKETQQIDRVMEAFAKRYNECNSGLFASVDQPYILAFSLMMLHTDAFNKNAKNKMTKADYLRNTGASGVPTEILEYLYDNLTFTQFIYVEDEKTGKRQPSEASGMSLTGTSVSTSLGPQSAAAANNRLKVDPYFLITQGRLGELRPDLEDLIPEDTPFSFTGSLPTFDVDRLNSAFLHAPSIEIVTTKNQNPEQGAGGQSPLDAEEEVVSLKVTKVGIVNRKDDVSDGGKKGASRKWKTSGLLLTGSQLLLFKDVIWINALQSQILDQVGHSLLCNGIPTDDESANDDIVEGGVIISPRITYFRPDGVISLADAVAVKDHSYGKYDFVFRLLAAKGRQYLVQAQSEDDMNDWIHKINFCASFRTCNIKIRGLDLAPRTGTGASLLEADASERFAALSRRSFSGSERATRRMDAEESGRSTPNGDDSGEISRDGASRSSMDPMTRPGDNSGPMRPRSSASLRLSPASSAIQKRARARREMMLTKIAETEVQLERASSRLAEEIRLARHFAILTPFLKSTRDRIEMSALPLASRIRSLRLDVAKTEARCKILRLDLAAGERVARALLPNTYLSSSAIRAANRLPSAQINTPQLLELGHVPDSQSQFEELFGPNGSTTPDLSSVPPSLSGTINKPASHQRNQMNLNSVSEQPADESPVMATGRPLPDVDDAEVEDLLKAKQNADEVPEEWDLSQVGRPGTNRISLVDLPSPNELEEATGGRFRFGRSDE